MTARPEEPAEAGAPARGLSALCRVSMLNGQLARARWPERGARGPVVEVRGDLRFAGLSSIDLKLPRPNLGRSESASALTDAANARLETVLARLALRSAMRDRPVGVDATAATAFPPLGGAPLLPDAQRKKAEFDKAAADLIGAAKNVASIYRAPDDARADALPPVQAAQPTTSPPKPKARASPPPRPPPVVDTVHAEVQRRVRFLQADKRARVAFYEEMAFKLAQLEGRAQGEQRMLANIAAVSDGALSPDGKLRKLEARRLRREERMETAARRKADAHAHFCEAARADSAFSAGVLERKAAREACARETQRALEWALLLKMVASLGRLEGVLRAARHQRVMHAASRRLQHAWRAHWLVVGLARFARSLRTLRRYLWRFVLGTRIRQHRRAAEVVRTFFKRVAETGAAQRLSRAYRFAVLRVQKWWRQLSGARLGALVVAKRQWANTEARCLAAAPLQRAVAAAVVDGVLRRDRYARGLDHLARLAAWRKRLDAAQRLAECAHEASAPESASVVDAAALQAVELLQRVSRGFLVRRRLFARVVSAAEMLLRPRFSLGLSDEAMAKLVAKTQLYVRMGKVPAGRLGEAAEAAATFLTQPAPNERLTQSARLAASVLHVGGRGGEVASAARAQVAAGVAEEEVPPTDAEPAEGSETLADAAAVAEEADAPPPQQTDADADADESVTAKFRLPKLAAAPTAARADADAQQPGAPTPSASKSPAASSNPPQAAGGRLVL